MHAFAARATTPGTKTRGTTITAGFWPSPSMTRLLAGICMWPSMHTHSRYVHVLHIATCDARCLLSMPGVLCVAFLG